MRVLALDAATEACSVALLVNGAVIARTIESGKSNALKMLSMTEEVLAEAQISLSMLDGIAASVGPGAFTGVRIGVAVAQGLAFGASLPVVAVTTLEALAMQAMRGGAEQVMACLDARMGEVYWGCFATDPERGVAARSAPAVGTAESDKEPFAGSFQGIGRGFAAYPILEALAGLALPAGASDALPDAKDMARLGAIRLKLGEGRDPADLIPVYLRDKVALTEVERAAAKQR